MFMQILVGDMVEVLDQGTCMWEIVSLMPKGSLFPSKAGFKAQDPQLVEGKG